METPSTIQRYLTRQGVAYDLVAHPHTGSSRETANAAHVREDHIAKGVIVKDDSGYAMVVVPASHWVEMDHLRRELDRDFHLVAESEIGPLFRDCEPGAIPPLGPAYGLETYVDDALSTLANVYFEVGDHEQLAHVSGDGFQQLLSGARHGYFSHAH
jgi:Ala-tRNA(Pro) deacylase